MRPDRMTTKSQEAFREAADLASRAGNPELVPEHLVLAMLEQDGGIAPPLFQKAGQRIKNDRAFQILLDEERAVKAARSKTTVSLVESERKTELERVEKQQKEREREFRTAVGLPPLKNDESPKADEKNVDLVLNETARVLDDLVFLPPTRQAWVTNGKGLAEFNF